MDTLPDVPAGTQHVVMFSGGVGSYVAAKRVIERYGRESVLLLFTDTKIEDEDLYRFLEDASRVLGVPLVTIAEGRTPWELFFDNRFMGNSRIDLCSRVLKRELADTWIRTHYPDPSTVRCYIGVDWTERHRFDRLAPRKLPYIYLAPLCEPPYIMKAEMFAIVQADGIALPRLYEMGFVHNNCGGFCVKAGQAHFKRLLAEMPERYRQHEEQEAAFQQFIGKPVTILRRQTEGVRRNVSLRQLREEIEAGAAIDPFDIGGCGCFSDAEESKDGA